MPELHWGLPVIAYLFLAGVGAGALTVSSSVLLRGGGGLFGGQHFHIARLGAFLAPLPLMIGTGMIVFELGTFQVAIANGEWTKLFRWIHLFLTVNLSPMNIGSWVLGACILTSIAYAYTFLGTPTPKDRLCFLRRAMAWIGVPLGIAVAVYTGVMLGAMPARPFWNSPVLAFLFLISALSTGVAGILLLNALFPSEKAAAESQSIVGTRRRSDSPAYLLAASDLMLIGFEFLALFLFLMFAHLTVGAPAAAVKVILPGGSLATLFWVGVVLIGLLVPAMLELRYVTPTLLYHRPFVIPRIVEISVATIVLFGGFLLRHVVVVAGQITGPSGL